MIQVKDKHFELLIPHDELQQKIHFLAQKINDDYNHQRPLFIAILNGSFMFASDLLKEISIECEISFVKVASYEEMESSGNVKQLIGLNENIFNRHVIIIEDIIDTGKTISKMLEEFKSLGATSVEVVSLFQKPTASKIHDMIRYVGFQLPDAFVLGYGLDYDGLGRNLKDLYSLVDSPSTI
ncbi:MAG: hypoxanthine phosphoribosyltransferase [Bacteroidota bacterium]